MGMRGGVDLYKGKNERSQLASTPLPTKKEKKRSKSQS
jgi:hypothetical protein